MQLLQLPEAMPEDAGRKKTATQQKHHAEPALSGTAKGQQSPVPERSRDPAADKPFHPGGRNLWGHKRRL